MKGLSTDHLNSVLKSNPTSKRFFIGTFPSCLIVRTRKKEFGFITNTENHESGGLHWNGWFVRNNVIYFFDSYGRPPTDAVFPHEYRDILLKYRQFKYFKYRIQSFNTHTCGYYCIHFILYFSMGLNFENLRNCYTGDVEKNDIIAVKTVNIIIN